MEVHGNRCDVTTPAILATHHRSLRSIGRPPGLVSAPDRLAPGFAPRAEIHPGQEFTETKENNSSDSALIDAKPGQPGGFRAGGLDHVKGLGLGLLVGVGVGIGIIAVGALLAVGWPVVLAAAGFAAVGGAIYGVFKGAQQFSVVECAAMSLIGGVSGGLGNWLGTMGIAGRTLWMAKAGIDVLAGGLMQTTAYMFGTPHPTGRGALGAFGIGAATACEVLPRWSAGHACKEL